MSSDPGKYRLVCEKGIYMHALRDIKPHHSLVRSLQSLTTLTSLAFASHNQRLEASLPPSMSTTHAQSGPDRLSANPTLSPTPTIHPDEHTLHSSPGKQGSDITLPSESTLGKVEKERIAEGKTDGFHSTEGAKALSSLPAGRKNILLLCFCLA